MSVEQVLKAVFIDELNVTVSAWRWTCKTCGFHETFPDNPMPEGRSEFDHQQRGWQLLYSDGDEGECLCPTCASRTSDRVRETLSGEAG